MGLGLCEFYRNKIKHEWKVAFFSTFILGLLIHIYKFTNTLPNHDALYNNYASQNMMKLGRWFLSFACGLSSYFDLPWVIGILSLVLIAFTTIVIIDLFKVSNDFLIVIISGLIVSFPSITETFFFEFTADGYMLAMLLAAFAVRFSSFEQKTKRAIAISAACICLSCATYQAYVSFALILSICYFISVLFENRYSLKENYKWILKQIIIYSTGLLSYYIIWKLCIRFGNYTISTYEGMSDIGVMNIGGFVNAIIKTVKALVQFFFEWNIFAYGLTVWNTLSFIFIIVTIVILCIGVKKSGLLKRRGQFVLLCLSVLAIPFFTFIWYFASPGVVYHTRMEQSLCVLYIFVAIMFDRWCKPKWSNLIAVLMIIIIFNNGITANMFYYYMNLCYERTYASALEITSRIHTLDDGTVEKVAFIGRRDGFSYIDYKKPNILGQLGTIKTVDYNLINDPKHLPLIMGTYLDFELSYYDKNDIDVPMFIPMDATAPTSEGWEQHFPSVDYATQRKLETTKEVKEMGCWPAADSVCVIDNIIVVKLSDVE